MDLLKAKYIEVSGEDIEVDYTDHRILDELERFGDYCSDKRKIRIADNLETNRHVEILLHELIHAQFDVTGLKSLLAGYNPELEHTIIYNLTPWLARLIINHTGLKRKKAPPPK